jgi:spore coat protein H
MPIRFLWRRAVRSVFRGGLAAWPLLAPAGFTPLLLAAPAQPDPSHALFAGTNVPHLRIEIPPEGMKILENYNQVWGQPRPERVDVTATVRHAGQVYTNIALHLKGSYTFQPIHGKPSLTLNFDKHAPGQRFQGLDKIHLNNSVQDPTYLCEKLARELFTAAGVPASRIGHARVTLNGRDLGLYVLVEGYNKRFLKRHFASTKGNLYDGGSGGDITKSLEVDSGDQPENRDDLKALAAAARETDIPTRLTQLTSRLDVDRFMTFAALEVLLLHWDGYCLGPNNFRLFRDTSTEQFVFLPHGLDQILGRGISLTTSLAPKWDGLVARALFKTPAFRQRYLERVRVIYTNHFQAPALLARVDQAAAHLRHSGAIPADEQDDHATAVADLKRRIQLRVTAEQQQIENPPRPVSFGPNNTLRLTGWQLNRSSRSGATGQRLRVGEQDLLQLKLPAEKWAAGSWRRSLLLGPGRYEFSGQARAANIPPNPTNGVVLRLSGDIEIIGVTNSTEWVTLRREFEVAGEVEEELICEVRGTGGTAQFDLSTLVLRRKAP